MQLLLVDSSDSRRELRFHKEQVWTLAAESQAKVENRPFDPLGNQGNSYVGFQQRMKKAGVDWQELLKPHKTSLLH